MLHQFDRATGVASNTIVLPPIDSILYQGGFGCEFSQFGNNFFISSGDSGSILWYSLANYDSATIVVSVHHFPPSIAWNVRSMQIGIDSKIYAVGQGTNLIGIENPDAPSSQVVINDSAISLAPVAGIYGLPDFIQTYFHPAYFDYSRACSHEPVKFWSRNTNIDSLRWDFGDPASGAANTDTAVHTFSHTDTFGVNLIAYNFCDTVSVSIRVEFDSVPHVNLDSSAYLCSNNITLAPNSILGNYVLWSTGDSTTSITADTAGTYWIETGNGCDTVADTIQVYATVTPTPLGYSSFDTCASPLSPLPLPLPKDGVDQWVFDRFGNELVDYYNFGLDTYQIIQYGGCDTISQTIIGFISMAPDGEIIIQRNLCEDGGLKLEFHGESNYTNLIWNTGQTSETIRPIDTGIYTVEIFEPPCRARLSVNIDALYCPDQQGCMPIMPNVFSPNGDGINEYFRPTEDLSYCLESNADLSIYNRWGVLLFYTKQVMVGWDGSVNGELSADGVYFYVFSTTDKNNEQQRHMGSVMLIR